MTTPIQPLANRVLLLPIIPKSESRIIAPENAEKPDPTHAEVIALGTSRTNKDGHPIDWSVKVGDIVAIVFYMGAPIPGSEMIIMKEDEILGIVPQP